MYKNYLLAILSGLLLAFAWPTYGLPLLIFVAFVPLLLAERAIRLSSPKRNNLHTFFASYISFIIWNTITTWWIWNSTEVGALFAIVVNSLLMSVVFQLYHLVGKRKPPVFSFIFLTALWLAFEKFHLVWEFSWPWLNLGNVFSEKPQWIQWYEYTGTFGGTLWIWWVNLSVFTAILWFQKTRNRRLFLKKLLLPFALVVLGIFISKYLYITYEEEGKELTAIALQPNTDPYTEKYYRTHEEITSDLLQLAQPKMDGNVRFVLAPETVFSNRTILKQFYRSKAYDSLQTYLSEHPQMAFLTGIDLYKIYDASVQVSPTANRFTNTDEAWYESYNAAMMLAAEQKPEVYYKSKLVVGVEHFPFRSVLQPLLGDIMIDLGGSVSTLTPQKEAEVFTYGKFRAAPIICYESIYGEYVGQYVQKGANFLANITNDSWWKRTEGHRQLLSYTKLRAIEHRRAIARSANSGISAFIDQRGEVLCSLPYETKGALKADIYANENMTFYTRHGDFIARIAVFVAVLFFLVGMFVKQKL